MIDDIIYIYDKNFGRTNSLLKLYKDLTIGKKGRRPVAYLDLLRVTVVMLHSTLEDYLRNLLTWKLPNSTKEKLNKIPLYSSEYDPRKTKFELGELIEHKDKKISELINLSVVKYLDGESFNNTTDINSALLNINLNVDDSIKKYYGELDKMIKRRHKIVHQADKDNLKNISNHNLETIDLQNVELWQKTVDQFVLETIKKLRN
jgi:RiboL-PSP-HEPN